MRVKIQVGNISLKKNAIFFETNAIIRKPSIKLDGRSDFPSKYRQSR